MKFNKKKLRTTCNQMLDDIEDQEIRSKGWIWSLSGAIIGLLISCVEVKNKITRPVIARLSRQDKIKGE